MPISTVSGWTAGVVIDIKVGEVRCVGDEVRYVQVTNKESTIAAEHPVGEAFGLNGCVGYLLLVAIVVFLILYIGPAYRSPEKERRAAVFLLSLAAAPAAMRGSRLVKRVHRHVTRRS